MTPSIERRSLVCKEEIHIEVESHNVVLYAAFFFGVYEERVFATWYDFNASCSFADGMSSMLYWVILVRISWPRGLRKATRNQNLTAMGEMGR